MKTEMAMIAVVVALVVFGAVAAEAKHSAAAPAPAVDCMPLFLGLSDCLPFVSEGSNDTKPAGTCCSGLKTILRTDAECLCEGFKSSSSLVISLNMTKALTLPSACHVSAPSIKNCGATLSPTGAPAGSPAGAPGSPTANAPGSGIAAEPTSGKNASPVVGVSLSSVVLCLAVAIFSSL